MTKALVTAHIKGFPKEQQADLNALRALIGDALPEAKEIIKYGIPTFAINGVPIIGFSGYKKNNSLFPYSGSVASKLEKELAGYAQTKGSIHIPHGKPFPKPLLNKLLKVKFLELKERGITLD